MRNIVGLTCAMMDGLYRTVKKWIGEGFTKDRWRMVKKKMVDIRCTKAYKVI